MHAGCSTLGAEGQEGLSEAGWARTRGTLQCELPNAELHSFKGRFDMQPGGQPAPATLLRRALRCTQLLLV